MNERQKRFSEFYAASGNAAQAAREAGYSERTARSIGQHLLTKVDIQKYVHELQEEMRASRVADAEEVRGILSDIIRDEGAKKSDRIKAGSVLLRASGEMVPPSARRQSITDDDTEEDDDNKPRTIIQLPYKGDNQAITARQLADGTIVPMMGHEDDDFFIYLPYSPEYGD